MYLKIGLSYSLANKRTLLSIASENKNNMELSDDRTAKASYSTIPWTAEQKQYGMRSRNLI